MLHAMLYIICTIPVGMDSESIQVRATAYCPCKVCCGRSASGITASGRSAGGRGVAVDPRLIPLGSHLDIPGYGNWIDADDTGSAIKGNRIDVRFQSHAEAKAYGVRTITIRVWRKR